MKLKRLFQVLVLGGTSLLAACGGATVEQQPPSNNPLRRSRSCLTAARRPLGTRAR
jgi:hypothetical protein